METTKLIQMQHAEFLAQRQLHEQTWQDCMDYLMPFRGDISTVQSEGSDRMDGIFDTTAQIAAMDHVNFLKSAIVPSGSRWVKFRAPRDYADDFELRDALYSTEERVSGHVERSNFYQQAGTFLYDMVVIGNSCMNAREGARLRSRPRGNSFGGLVYEAVPMRRVVWKFGPDGFLETCMREFSMQAYRAFDFFEQPGKLVAEAMKDERPMKEFKFVHAAHLNMGPFKAMDEGDWVQRWYCVDKEWELLDTRGMESSRYIGARWFCTDGEQYGRGPGHIVRPDAMAANVTKKKMLQAVDYELDPPVGIPSHDYFDFDMGPGGFFIMDQEVPNAQPQAFQIGARIDYAQAILGEDRGQIDRGLMGDLIRGQETQPRSAYESRRQEMKEQRRFAAPADTIRNEFLVPVMDATVNILLRAGELPELEEQVQKYGGELDIVYDFVSPFFLSQKQEQVERVQMYVARQIELAQATQNEEHLDPIDFDALHDWVARESEIPTDVLSTPDMVEEKRMARAEAAMAMQQREQMTAEAQAMRDMAPAIAAAEETPA